MKKVFLCFLACGLGFAVGCSKLSAVDAPESPQSSAPGPAPASDPATTEARWLTSLPQAQALAQKENKLVLVDFTGSDWCVWCKKLDAEVFSKAEFASYASKHLVLVELDFPSHKPQPPSLKAANEALMRKYNVKGFPTLLVIKPDGAVVWKQDGYLQGGPSAMLAKLDEARNK
jgi:thiol:disulfide interchange protein